MKDRKTKIWIMVLAAVCVLGTAAFWLLRTSPTGTTAVITVDGAEYERIDLSRVKEGYDIRIETRYGYNIVHVQPGAISVAEANCPDGICVRQGRLEGGGVPIVCMPHRLVIQIEGGDIDA